MSEMRLLLIWILHAYTHDICFLFTSFTRVSLLSAYSRFLLLLFFFFVLEYYFWQFSRLFMPRLSNSDTYFHCNKHWWASLLFQKALKQKNISKTFLPRQGCFMFSLAHLYQKRQKKNTLTPTPNNPFIENIHQNCLPLPTGDARYFWNKWVNTSSKQD